MSMKKKNEKKNTDREFFEHFKVIFKLVAWARSFSWIDSWFKLQHESNKKVYIFYKWKNLGSFIIGVEV